MDNIDKLIKKSHFKEINNMEYVDEIIEAAKLMVENSDSQKEMEYYRNNYETLALSMLKEPLSDIPMGQVMQFLPILKQEYLTFKEVFNEYKNGTYNTIKIKKQYDRFDAVSKYISDLYKKLGDHTTIYIPELDELDISKKNVVDYTNVTDINIYYEAMEDSFTYLDHVIKFIYKAYETRDKGLFHASAFVLDTQMLYIYYIVEEFVRKM